MTRAHLLVAAACFFPLQQIRAASEEATAPRQRISINADWRFAKGDPDGNAAGLLLYDVRPAVTERGDARPADAEPQAPEKTTTPAQAMLKPWILPTGNRFIRD